MAMMGIHLTLYNSTTGKALRKWDGDAAAAKAQSLGASVHFGPATMEGVGRWSVVSDPQGAVFALFQPLPHA